MHPSEPHPGRHDLLLVVAAVAVLFFLGVAFDIFDRFEPVLARRASGDELIGLLLLVLGGVAVIATRRARITRGQMARRAVADEHLEALIAESPVVSYSWLPQERRYRYVSPQVETLFGVSTNAHVADWGALIHPDDVERVRAISEDPVAMCAGSTMSRTITISTTRGFRRSRRA